MAVVLPPVLNPAGLRDVGKRSINRAPSPIVARAVPWLVIMLGSMSPTWPVIASAPVLPPFGFLLLISWQQLRPGLFPVWAGLPLGLFDDLFSGQPFGSAVLLWSVAMIAIDLIENRFPWRSFAQDWLIASGIIAAYLVLTVGIANFGGAAAHIGVIAPQLILAVLTYPITGRIVGLMDRARLLKLKVI